VESVNRLDDIGDAADRLDLSASALYGLRHAAIMSDASFEDLQTGLERLLANVGEAAMGNKELGRSFQRLGLDASDLEGMKLDQSFLTVAGALSEVKSKYEQAALAKSIFGKGAVSLLPLLRQGKDGIEQLAHQVGMADSAFREADLADKNVKRLNASWENLKDTLASQVLPAVNSVMDAMNRRPELADGGKGMSWMDRIALGMRIGTFALTHRDQEFYQSEGGDFTQENAFARHDEQRIAEQVKREEKAADAIKRIREELAFELATLGMSEADREERRLASMGVAGEDLDAIRALQQQIDLTKQLAAADKQMAENMAEWGRVSMQVWQQTRTPLEQFDNDLNDLALTMANSPLDGETFKRRVGQLTQGLIDSAGESSFQLPTALTRGSVGAVSAINQNLNASRIGNDPASKIERALKIHEQKLEYIRRFNEEAVKIMRERWPEFFAGNIPE
jgi:hypothetical protein